ncbi:MAG TPA: hypothetical protein VIF12_04155 [Micavibrio sp.]|jgi:nicotinate phosphoribosyltransferase
MSDLANLDCEFNNIIRIEDIRRWTDKYFTKTRAVVEAEEKRLGREIQAAYAIFIRQPAVFAPAYMLTWLKRVAEENDFKIEVDLMYHEGQQMRAGDPMMFISGRMADLVELETHYLQKIGPPCIAAYNAKNMAKALPHINFLALDVRHAAGMEMAEMMAYAASVGSRAARKDGAKGFIGNATDATAHFFGNRHGLGTSPHALIGMFHDAIEAAEAYHRQFPNEPMTILVDYDGLEVSNSIALARKFPALTEQGKLSVRVDTNGARYLEGLDHSRSYEVVETSIPDILNMDLDKEEIENLVGKGVSAAAIWHLRNELNKAGADRIKIVASSGFNTRKCNLMNIARAPIDVVGTGSFLPEKWPETYATSDIVAYGGTVEGIIEKVKVGRQYLIEQRHKKKPAEKITLG